jgi:hypothetical protein
MGRAIIRIALVTGTPDCTWVNLWVADRHGRDRAWPLNGAQRPVAAPVLSEGLSGRGKDGGVSCSPPLQPLSDRFAIKKQSRNSLPGRCGLTCREPLHQRVQPLHAHPVVREVQLAQRRDAHAARVRRSEHRRAIGPQRVGGEVQRVQRDVVAGVAGGERERADRVQPHAVERAEALRRGPA